MDKYPEIYIIILNFNACMETIQCIESIEKITYPNYKIIIVDNKSEDNSVKIIREKFPQHILLIAEENRGYASGNNMAIKYAMDQGAEFICILNNDVEVEREFLEPLVLKLQSKESIGMVGPCICEYFQRDKVQAMGANINLYTGLAQAKLKGREYKSISNEILEVDYLGGACFLFKREVINKIGYIPENYFLFFEETEFCLRAKKSGYKLICLPESKVYHKGSATISKFKGLSYYYLNRNRVVFMRRNANFFQFMIFLIYVLIEGIGRMIIRKEPLDLLRFYLKGLTADTDSFSMAEVQEFLKNKN